MAMCRDNYGFGYVQAANRTHLHWTWKLTGAGTPRDGGPLPPRSGARVSDSCRPLPCRLIRLQPACVELSSEDSARHRGGRSTIPRAALADELWLIKDPARRGGNPVTMPPEGPRRPQRPL